MLSLAPPAHDTLRDWSTHMQAVSVAGSAFLDAFSLLHPHHFLLSLSKYLYPTFLSCHLLSIDSIPRNSVKMSNTSGVYGACPDMVDPLSLTANIIQILTFTTVVLVGLLWRTSIVANAQYEAGSLYIEAEIRMEIWQTQIREFNTSTADVWRAQNTARYALNHAETNLDEFRALLERLGRAHLNKRTGRIRNLLVGFRYMRRRDELKAKLAKVECLMELADKVIDQ
jgi:hypothetical protein